MFYHVRNAWGTTQGCGLLEFSAILDTKDGVIEWFNNDDLIKIIESGIKIKGCKVKDFSLSVPSSDAFINYIQRLDDVKVHSMLMEAFKKAEDLVNISDCFNECFNREVHLGTYIETCDCLDVPLRDR